MSDISEAYGALREGVHIGGYSFERAFSRLEWLLTDNRWQQVDGGKFGDVNGFLSSIQLEGFRIVAEQRKRIAARIKELQPEASNRRIAATLGVHSSTIDSDVAGFPAAGRQSTERPRLDAAGFPATTPNATEIGGSDTATNVAASPPPTETPTNHRAMGTGENEWYTPPEVIALAKSVLGEIDLDPASSPAANKEVGAKEFFDIQTDGLARKWCGRIWLNPPYSQPTINFFINKLLDEYRDGNVSEAIVLTHNYTDTAWFHRMLSIVTAVCFTRGRIAFVSPSGAKAAPTQGQAFFYVGERAKEFEHHFSNQGIILWTSKNNSK